MENQTPPKRLATNNLKKIIKDRLDQLKLSPKAAEKTAGVPPDTIKSVLRGQRTPLPAGLDEHEER